MKKIFVLTIIYFIIYACAPVGTQLQDTTDSQLAAKVPKDPDVRIGKLDNGLTYYIRNNKKPENRVEMLLVLN